MNGKTILLTGGAGYIGSHACIELVQEGYRVIVVDNFSNSCVTALERVAEITNKEMGTNPLGATEIMVYKGDICNEDLLSTIFASHNIDAVMHFAGLKAVGDSLSKPLEYYNNNVVGTIILLKVMAAAGVKTVVFSSSATVYGAANEMPVTEDFSTGATTNPYGQSKYIIEQIMKDIAVSDVSWKICSLRYFNPAGAHASGMIGEDPAGTPNNLLPYISQVAMGRLERLMVFGSSYPTVDGTGVRDYIHVVDLAKGHISALRYLASHPTSGFSAFNLGTGKGTSVFQMLRAFERASGKAIPFEVINERGGDIAECWASTHKAEAVLGWKANYDVNKMCEDTWNWQIKNPSGYRQN